MKCAAITLSLVLAMIIAGSSDALAREYRTRHGENSPGYLSNLQKNVGRGIEKVATSWTAPLYRMGQQAGRVRSVEKHPFDWLRPITRGLPQGLGEAVDGTLRGAFGIVEGVTGQPTTSSDKFYWKRSAR